MGKDTRPEIIWTDYQKLRSLRKVADKHGLSHQTIRTILLEQYPKEYEKLSNSSRKKKCIICRHFPTQKNKKICPTCEIERLETGTVISRQGVLHLKFHKHVKKHHPYMRTDNSLNIKRFAVELMYWVYSTKCQKNCFRKKESLKKDTYGLFYHSGMVLKSEFCVTKYFEIIQKKDMLRRELLRQRGKEESSFTTYHPEKKELLVPLLWVTAFFELPRINDLLPMLRYFPTNITMQPILNRKKWKCRNINNNSNPYNVYGTFVAKDLHIYFYWKPIWRQFAFKRKNRNSRIKKVIQSAIIHELGHRLGNNKEDPQKKNEDKPITQQTSRLIKQLRKSIKQELGVTYYDRLEKKEC